MFIYNSIEGGELFDRVIDDEFVLTEKTCTILVRQLCQAMEFVHSNNILHLDLKPENILCLTREGNRIKVIDFGLARRYDPEKKLQVSWFDSLCLNFRARRLKWNGLDLRNEHLYGTTKLNIKMVFKKLSGNLKYDS